MEFSLTVVAVPPDAFVTVRGDLDLATSPELRERLRAEIESGCRRVLVDLSATTFVDASALGALATTRRALVERDGLLRFTAYPQSFLRLCRATGLAVQFGLDPLGGRREGALTPG
jgi:anti-sigma B factor antagonist